MHQSERRSSNKIRLSGTSVHKLRLIWVPRRNGPFFDANVGFSFEARLSAAGCTEMQVVPATNMSLIGNNQKDESGRLGKLPFNSFKDSFYGTQVH